MSEERVKAMVSALTVGIVEIWIKNACYRGNHKFGQEGERSANSIYQDVCA